MQAGKLRDRITIEQSTPSQDGAGQPIDSWATLATVWAHVRGASARERFEADQRIGSTQMAVEIRYRGDVTEAMRVLWRGDYYNIVSQADPDGRRVRLRLIMERSN